MLNLYNINNHAEQAKTGVPKKKADFSKYVTTDEETSAKELSWGIWYAKHAVLLYRILAGCLMGISAALWIFSIWGWIDYLLGLQDSRNVDANLTSFIDYSQVQSAYGARPLQIAGTDVYPSNGDKTDIVSVATNPNSRFFVGFDYYYIINGEKSSVQTGFLLPGETRPIAYLGAEGDVGLPQLVIENFAWKRISNHQITNPQDWQAYRLNFSVSDFVFLKGLGQGGSNADAVQFKLTNNSPYSYSSPDFYVSLLQDGNVVGILPLHLDSIKTLETKNIDLRSVAPGLSVSEIAVYPLINVYDPSVYITY